MTATGHPESPAPRNWWPIGLVLVMVAFVSFEITMVLYSRSHFEGPDDNQYYKHGLNYGQELQRQRRQQELGWTLWWNRSAEHLELELRDRAGRPLEGRFSLALGRPATNREDRALHPVEVSPGHYQADLAVGPGRWRLKVTAQVGPELYKESLDFQVDGARP